MLQILISSEICEYVYVCVHHRVALVLSVEKSFTFSIRVRNHSNSYYLRDFAFESNIFSYYSMHRSNRQILHPRQFHNACST